MNEQIQAAGKIILTVGGGWLASRGYIKDTQVEALAGAVMIMLGALWASYNARLAAKQKQNVKIIQTSLQPVVPDLKADGKADTVTIAAVQTAIESDPVR